MDQFANLVDALRSAGLSQSEIAMRSGLSRQTVWRYATGEARSPTLESFQKLEKLAQRVGIAPTTGRKP